MVCDLNVQVVGAILYKYIQLFQDVQTLHDCPRTLAVMYENCMQNNVQVSRVRVLIHTPGGVRSRPADMGMSTTRTPPSQSRGVHLSLVDVLVVSLAKRPGTVHERSSASGSRAASAIAIVRSSVCPGLRIPAMVSLGYAYVQYSI